MLTALNRHIQKLFALSDERMNEEEKRLFGQLRYSERRRLLRLREPGYRSHYWAPGLPAELMGGGSQAWIEPLDIITADGTAVTAASETIMCPDASIPANFMAPGRSLRIWAAGTVTTVVTTPGTGTWRVRWGGVGGVQLLASAAQNFSTTAQTADGWNMWAVIVSRTAGATGTFMSAGELNNFNVLETTAANLKSAVMGSAGTNSNAAVTVDTTAVKALSCTFTQTVTTGSLTCQHRLLEAYN